MKSQYVENFPRELKISGNFFHIGYYKIVDTNLLWEKIER